MTADTSLPLDPNTELEYLHPVFRAALEGLLVDLEERSLRFRVFEAWRSPFRQRYLYSKGRFGPLAGRRIVTSAKPWRSIHQFGLAVDLVWFEGGRWSWGRHPWNELHELAARHDLTGIYRKGRRIEAPHLQLRGIDPSALYRGVYPPDGSEAWAANLEASILSWVPSKLRLESKAPPLPETIIEGSSAPASAVAVAMAGLRHWAGIARDQQSGRMLTVANERPPEREVAP